MNRKKILAIVIPVAAVLLAGAALLVYFLVNKVPPKICLDAGHGGSDVGAEVEGRYEKDDNLKLTLAVGKILEENGVEVIYTRKGDDFVSLDERAEFANENKATYFVSIHRNSAASQVSGVEIWIENTASLRAEKQAECIIDKIFEVGYGNNRGVRRGYQGNPSANYHVNAATEMASCLVEMGFITTPEDNELFDKNFEEYALAIAQGIMEGSGVR